MPRTLTVGLSKKTGRPNSGSLQVSCRLRFELGEAPPGDAPDHLQLQARRAFAACRQSVDEELARQSEHSQNGRPHTDNGPQHVGRRATPAQIQAIRGIAVRRRIDLYRLLTERFGVNRPEELTLLKASRLICELLEEKRSRG